MSHRLFQNSPFTVWPLFLMLVPTLGRFLVRMLLTSSYCVPSSPLSAFPFPSTRLYTEAQFLLLKGFVLI